ncbi:MAG: hypothetical protein V4588_08630 [Pseudomonadota bacterium]
MYKKLPVIMIMLLTGCLTMSGAYSISAYDSEGKLLNEKMQMIAEGSGIYSVRNAICQTYPKATVLIKDIKTGAELKSESPYKCP